MVPRIMPCDSLFSSYLQLNLQEKIARFLEAFFFQVAKIARMMYANMRGGDDSNSNDNTTDQ